jgi:LysM repeat protein/ABC-type branched-subunit amino acid transport system substrate-binding protein
MNFNHIKGIIKTIVVLIFLSASTVSAQQTTVRMSNNKVSLNGKPYYIHIVRKGETLSAISRAYNVPVDTIKKDNLHISDTIKINQFLKIRINKKEKNKQKFIYHQVKKGDTAYNLSVKYNISIDELYKYNPEAKLGITIGEVLKIPLPYTESSDNLHKDIVEQQPNNSDSYFIYKVKKKETLYGITAKFNTTQDKIKELNPELNERSLQVNQEIKIPLSTEQENIQNADYYYHKVKKQETIFGITQLYKIKPKQLYKLNPDLKNRTLQEGELIKVPKNSISDTIFAKEEIVDTVTNEPHRDSYTFWKDSLLIPDCIDKQINTDATYKVALFLPFYLNINDTLGKYTEVKTRDTDGIEIIESVLKTGKIEDKIYQRSKIFIDFYQGALLALLDLKEKGISFNIKVFDTQNDTNHVKEILRINDLSNYDLFIGPVFGNNLEIVGDYAWEHQINIVSPLSLKNKFIEHNPYAFQVSPPFEIQMQHASDFLNNFDVKNYIVIHDGNNLDQNYIAQFKQQLFAQMNEDNFSQIKYNEVFYYDARDSVLKSVFTPGIKNIVIIPSGNQAFVTDVIGKLNAYSYDYDITVFGQPKWIRFENIELSNFHNTNTHIFSNSFIDYNNPDVIDFVKKYRFYFKGESEKYAFQGYDICKYFCIALNKYGKDFRKCIHNNKVELLQTNFNFVPVSNQGGYQNTAIYILEYSKDFKLRKVAEFPQKK